MVNVPFYQDRGSAVALVVLSGATIFCLSFAIQVFAWELRPLLHARFGWDDNELPLLTKAFLQLFGHRPESYLTFVVWWFWWPMVGSLGYCHFRYRNPSEFGSAFIFAFVFCWLVLLSFFSVILMICSMPFVILLADLTAPPAVAALITPISWLIPASVLVFLVLMWRRSARRPRAEGADALSNQST